MQLGLEKLRRLLVGLHVSIDGFACVLEDLVFKSVSQIESNVVSIGFNCKSEEL